MVRPGSPTKNDLALRRMEDAHEFRMLVAHIAALVLVILSFSVPLFVVRLLVSDLAGKETVISGELGRIVADVVGGGSALAVIAAVIGKNRSQRAELQRLRRRCEALEAELENQP